eukprot:16869-Heterococcus_DN1.PRE.1
MQLLRAIILAMLLYDSAIYALQLAFTRRAALQHAGIMLVAVAVPLQAPAAELLQEPIIRKLKVALSGLDDLLDNWQEYTTDCRFADVDRTLLEGKNKAKLLRAATTNALFDKTDAVMSCKRNASKVRDRLGFTTSDTPLYGAELLMQKAAKLIANPDATDSYLSAVEEFQQAMLAADSTARLAAVGDFSSYSTAKDVKSAAFVNWQVKWHKTETDTSVEDNDYISQSRTYVMQARQALLEITDVNSVSQLMLRQFASEVRFNTNSIVHRSKLCAGQYSPMNDTYDRIVLAVLMLEHRQKALSDDIKSPVVPYALTHSSINQTFTDSALKHAVTWCFILREHHSDITDTLKDLQTLSSLCLMLVLVFQFFAAM